MLLANLAKCQRGNEQREEDGETKIFTQQVVVGLDVALMLRLLFVDVVATLAAVRFVTTLKGSAAATTTTTAAAAAAEAATTTSTALQHSASK